MPPNRELMAMLDSPLPSPAAGGLAGRAQRRPIPATPWQPVPLPAAQTSVPVNRPLGQATLQALRAASPDSAVLQLMTADGSVNQSFIGMPLLLRMIEEGNSEVIDILLQRGAPDISAVHTSYNDNALHMACDRSRAIQNRLGNYLLQQSPAVIDTVLNQRSITRHSKPINASLRAGNTDYTRQLLQASLALDPPTSGNNDPLSDLSLHNTLEHPETLEDLLRFLHSHRPEALPQLLEARDEQGYTPLLAALSKQTMAGIQSARMLQAYGADLSARNNDGQSALNCLFDRIEQANPPAGEPPLRQQRQVLAEMARLLTGHTNLETQRQLGGGLVRQAHRPTDAANAAVRQALEALAPNVVMLQALADGRANLNQRDERGISLLYHAVHRSGQMNIGQQALLNPLYYGLPIPERGQALVDILLRGSASVTLTREEGVDLYADYLCRQLVDNNSPESHALFRLGHQRAHFLNEEGHISHTRTRTYLHSLPPQSLERLQEVSADYRPALAQIQQDLQNRQYTLQRGEANTTFASIKSALPGEVGRVVTSQVLPLEYASLSAADYPTVPPNPRDIAATIKQRYPQLSLDDNSLRGLISQQIQQAQPTARPITEVALMQRTMNTLKNNPVLHQQDFINGLHKSIAEHYRLGNVPRNTIQNRVEREFFPAYYAQRGADIDLAPLNQLSTTLAQSLAATTIHVSTGAYKAVIDRQLNIHTRRADSRHTHPIAAPEFRNAMASVIEASENKRPVAPALEEIARHFGLSYQHTPQAAQAVCKKVLANTSGSPEEKMDALSATLFSRPSEIQVNNAETQQGHARGIARLIRRAQGNPFSRMAHRHRINQDLTDAINQMRAAEGFARLSKSLIKAYRPTIEATVRQYANGNQAPFMRLMEDLATRQRVTLAGVNIPD